MAAEPAPHAPAGRPRSRESAATAFVERAPRSSDRSGVPISAVLDDVPSTAAGDEHRDGNPPLDVGEVTAVGSSRT